MRWRRWTESLLNEALRAPATVWKARFLVECLLVGVLASSAFVVLLFATGHHLAAIATVAGDVAFVLCLAALKRVKRYDVVAHVGLAVCLGVFGIPSVTERELDPAILAWTCVVPYIAALILPTRRALFWGAVSLGAIAFVLVLRGPGTGAAPDMLVSTARVVALVATVFVFGIRFAQEQGSALSELSSANRAKSAFLATMSHEIRTPMNGVLGITEVLLSGPLDVETREKLNLVRESGHTLVALINATMLFAATPGMPGTSTIGAPFRVAGSPAT
jgi:signal transduction histidine kinase